MITDDTLRRRRLPTCGAGGIPVTIGRSMARTGIKPQPVYAAISEKLRAGIARRTLPPGTPLHEAPLAKLFGSSRSPVKRALEQLADKGLLARHDGRGFQVGPAGGAVRRCTITRAMLGLSSEAPESLRLPAWETMYDRIERELVQRSILGQFRVNELELSRHYRIGRTVAHDVLTQIQSTGIISRRNRTQWLTVPLDTKRINDLFDLRLALEPPLCTAAAQIMPDGEFIRMRADLVAGAGRYPAVAAEAMDELERDLHIRVLEYGGNVEFFEALRRTRCILISAWHIFRRAVPYPRKGDFFFQEHQAVLDALRRRDGLKAGRALAVHLERSRERVIERLADFREHQRMKPISFILPA